MRFVGDVRWTCRSFKRAKFRAEFFSVGWSEATIATEVEATSILPSLNGKTTRSWRGIVHSTHLAREGAYDSHHRTTRIAGRTRRRGGRLAARGARAAASDAGGRVSQRPVA